jgi:predicted PurR-regulated permease PerM
MPLLDRPATRDIPRILFVVLSIGGLISASLWIMKPFLGAIVWAAMFAIATWPLLISLEARFGGRRAPAVAVMLLALLMVLVVPTWLAISTISDNADRLGALAYSVLQEGLPPPPPWLERVPLVGARFAERWQEAANPESLAARLAPHLREAATWVASRAAGVGSAFLQFLLTVLISGILYASGESAALGVRRFLRRLAGERGENIAFLAARAVRAVALGVVVTALAQTAIAGVGLVVDGVPHAGLLAAIVLVLCIAQLGPLLVLAPATIWLYATGHPVKGTVLLVFTIAAQTIDNFIRPVLIRRGADLPLLLIFAGVIGGLVAFGVVGLFVGPVVLGVAWTLVSSWVAELDAVDPTARPAPPA